jgi:hypothetical protein
MRNPVQKFFDEKDEFERRCEPRVEAESGARMKVLDPLMPTAQFIDARLVSVSAKGLQLRVGFIIPNEPVQIQLDDRTVLGDVRYCISAGDDFRVGIRVAA